MRDCIARTLVINKGVCYNHSNPRGYAIFWHILRVFSINLYNVGEEVFIMKRLYVLPLLGLLCFSVMPVQAMASTKTTTMYTTKTCTVRAKASAESKKLGSLAKAKKVVVLSKTGKWYKIKYKSKTGYIKTTLSDSKPKPLKKIDYNEFTGNTAPQGDDWLSYN